MRPLTLGRLFLRCGILALDFIRCRRNRSETWRCPGFPLRSRPRLDPRSVAPKQLHFHRLRHDRRGHPSPSHPSSGVVGASLSVAGTSFQALLRNPLADPYVLGISSGAAVGAILALMLENQLSFRPSSRVSLPHLEPSSGRPLPSPAFISLGGAKGKLTAPPFFLVAIITASFLSADHYVPDVHADRRQPCEGLRTG